MHMKSTVCVVKKIFSGSHYQCPGWLIVSLIFSKSLSKFIQKSCEAKSNNCNGKQNNFVGIDVLKFRNLLETILSSNINQ